MNRLERLKALQVSMRAWVGKQGEPFDTSEFAGRFGIRHLTAMKYLRQMQAAGALRQISKEHFGKCAIYEKVLS